MAKLIQIPTPPSKHSLADLTASLPERERSRRLRRLPQEQREALRWDWRYWGGWSNNRLRVTGAHGEKHGRTRAALVAPIAADGRDVMIEGESGVLASCRYPEAWDMLMFGMRLGDDPRVVVTTTPKPTKVIRDLLAERS
jgi:phage terminase large subunit-like protein